MAARKTAAQKAAEAAETENDYGQVISRTDQNRPFVTSNRFSASNVEVRGRELLALAPTNHVGPAPILVPMAELDELIADLSALRDQPGPFDEHVTSEDETH
jgi:hypothetical protein